MNHLIHRATNLITPAIMLVFSLPLISAVVQDEIVVQWQHYVAFVMALLTMIAFFYRIKWGVLTLTLFCLLGISGVLSISTGIIHSKVSIGNLSLPFADLYFLLFLVLNITLSFIHFKGILTRAYWKALVSQNTTPDE